MSLIPNTPPDPVGEAERLFSAAAEAAGPRLTELVQALSIGYVNERDHLQPTFRQALKDTVKDERPRPAVSFDLNHGLEELWPSLGRFDDALAWGRRATAFAELKAGSDEGALSACAWDAIKCAFCLRHAVGAAAFLIAAAPEVLWRRRCLGLELFDDGGWDTTDLRRRYAKGFRKWERDGYKPLRVPAALRTHGGRRLEFLVGTEPWMLGLARVEPLGESWLDWAPLVPARLS